MRVFITAALAASLIATNLYAADATVPLPSGKPAGVQKAQDMSDNSLWFVLGGAVAVAIGLVAAGGGNSPVALPAGVSTTS